MDLARAAGLLLGLLGVGMLVGLDVGELGAAALLEVGAVVVGYATAPVIMARRLADLPSIPVVSAALLLTAVGYLPFAVTHWPATVSAGSLGSVLVLGVVCTAVAFVLFFALIRIVGPARSTVITYVNPAVALLLGVVLLGERFTLGMAIGFPLILVGSVLAARRRAPAADQPGDQSMRTVPIEVSNTAATTPLSSSVGTSQSTAMPSSGCAAAVPRQSSTARSLPAISNRVSVTVAPSCDGCWSSSLSQCTKNGSCGSAIRSLTPTCSQRRSNPSGRRR
jgi:uncharacterized membrane protein